VSAAAPLRLVLDTNVWLDWLAFDDAAIAPLKHAQAEGVIEIFSDEACTRELVTVLNYDLGKRSLDTEKRSACLAAFHALVHTAPPSALTAETLPLPKCRDPDDQKFLELARDCGADYLVTKDKALLLLARRKTRPAPCRIVTPLGMGDILETGSGPVERCPEVY
jgi:putative PIN family toxin of toxin-antitoxin system